MKKIIGFILSSLLLVSMVGCGGNEAADKDVPSDVVSDTTIDKDKIKSKAEKALEDKNVTNIDVLTDSSTGEAMLSVQLQGNIDKADINKSELEELCKGIEATLADIAKVDTIEFIDKNFQMILLYGQGNFTYFE